jgi:excisionase family DNA binding protein
MINDDKKSKIKKVFKVNEAAIYLGVNESFIYKIIKSKELVAIKFR